MEARAQRYAGRHNYSGNTSLAHRDSTWDLMDGNDGLGEARNLFAETVSVTTLQVLLLFVLTGVAGSCICMCTEPKAGCSLDARPGQGQRAAACTPGQAPVVQPMALRRRSAHGPPDANL